ncbi:MAG: hypothetical protein MAG451_02949 [Anaerolineales bacterium]|nr:hypothetical protein [Anaerolineales bacterium]
MARERKRRRRRRKRKSPTRKKKQTTQRGKSKRIDPMLRLAGRWSLHEVLITETWREEGEIIQVLVARRSGMGQVAVGSFLIDLGCLGVKNAFASLFSSQREYERELRSQVTAREEMVQADLNLVAKIVQEAIAYAHELGFSPNPDYRDAMMIVGDADPDACGEDIPLGGEDGQPLFVAGPYDDVDAIMEQLTEVCGPDGFHFVAPLDPDTGFFL